MKTIMVLTDFSPEANHAAGYALKFAQAIKSDLLLFNAFGIPEKNAVASQISWPSNYTDLQEESLGRLKDLASELSKKLEDKNSHSFKPGIRISNDFGAVADLASEIVIQKAIGLIIMSGPKSDKVKRLFFGSDTHDLLDKVICPLMVIPDGIAFRVTQKITYATDLRSKDTAVLQSLGKLAELFSAEFTVAHVSEYRNLKKEDTEDYLSECVQYPKINYKNIKGRNIVQSLCDINKMEHADIIALVHKKYHFPESIFHNSVSKQMANYTQIPLLIYPFTYTEYLSHNERKKV